MDWTWPAVKAALEEQGTNLQRLAQAHGVDNSLLTKVKYTPTARGEAIISAALRMAPQTIWPTRYTTDGLPVVPLAWRERYKPTTGVRPGNVQNRKVA